MPLIKLNATQGLTGTLPAVSGANLTNLSAGKVLQVKQTNKTDTFSTTSTSFTDVTGLSVSITPSSSSNKILVIVDLQVGSRTDSQCMFQLLRGSTSINIGDASGSRTRATAEQDAGTHDGANSIAITFLDTPNTTSATTYKIQMRVTGNTHCINRTRNDADASSEARTTSSITVMEIEA
jgi:hypothetical protein